MTEFAEFLPAVIEAVKLVAEKEVIPRYLRVAHHHKSDGSVFTEADIAAQESLTEKLTKIHTCPVVAEEMTQEQQLQQWRVGDEGLWCIDPIDGTSNFVNGLPYFSVSVAFMQHGRSVLGVIYDPIADEMFYAKKGGGAFLNGERLPIKEYSPHLGNALASVNFTYLNGNLVQSLAMSPPYSSQRNFGASTLEWCYTAAGRFDVSLHGSQKLWDYAAGCLILEEAGGLMCTLEHDDFWVGPLWERSVIAAINPALFAAWKTWIKGRQ